MEQKINYFLSIIMVLCFFGCTGNKESTKEITEDEINRAWQKGQTLPESVFEKYPLQMQNVQNDEGINVLIDLAHQCKFVTLWGLPARLNSMGFRAIGSQASLHSVLDKKGRCRVRVRWDEENKIFPFAWHPNFKYNVIITNQSDPNAQVYLAEEQDAIIDFVKNGGGLIIFGNRPKDKNISEQWSLNSLCHKLGAKITEEKENYEGRVSSVIAVSDDWKVFWKGENGLPVAVNRKLGKGNIFLFGDERLLEKNRNQKKNNDEKNQLLKSIILQASKGKSPVGGEPRYPLPNGGGGGIYPEVEKHFGDIVLFYAANQKTELLNTVNNDIPIAKKLVEKWLPSTPTLEPMYLILASGGGGGWAVNAFKPKENGIISLSPMGILSIFAHELAHTMHGPVNDEGNVAGITPIPNRGEAHAGWFQGKVDAWFIDELKDYPVKKCNSLFLFDPEGKNLDLVTHYENAELREKYGKGKDWVKTWWIWQKLDDRYGVTWYPRWKYVQHTRWKNEPMHRLSWDEMVEDMSIAVGEDLFPFLRKAGLSLEKKRFSKGIFNGKEIELPVAPIHVKKAGNVNLGKIDDYKLPIKVK